MNQYDVAAYIWPAYSGDDLRSRIFWEEGTGEWQTVRKAVKKRPGHSWPRKPLWGYVNEADPYVMEMEIDAAADHGVNVFIYDWYWYDRMPFLETCLNEGYLKAGNNGRVRFFLMWANHSVPLTWDIRNADGWHNTLLWDGAVDRAEFERVGHRLIEKYFSHPAYYRIDGKPAFQIYDLPNLVRGLGSIASADQALRWLNDECVRAGLGGIHLILTHWKDEILGVSGVDSGCAQELRKLYDGLCFDGITHYQFCHIADVARDYNEIMKDAEQTWTALEDWKKPYYPHISVGWDNNPRFYEYQDIVTLNNTPENVEAAFRKAKAYVDAHPGQAPLITVNSWNEWTETSYLQPDNVNGYGYLKAIKNVFLR